MTVALAESRSFAEAATPADGPGRLLVKLITPGWGSSGYYSAAAIEQAATDRIWPRGTHMYLDHPTPTEDYERPARTVKDLAAVLMEDARWDPNIGPNGALVAETRVFSRWRHSLAEMADAIGVSIRGEADVELGEAEGRAGKIITRFTRGKSVDFVTKAGRGGAFEVLESARDVQEARNVGQWVESRIHRDFTTTADEMFGDGRLTREERITLSSAIGDALGAFVARLEADAPALYQRDLWEEPPLAAAAAVEAAVARGLDEATAGDQRECLSALVRDAHATKGEDDDTRTWAWVRDFDPGTHTVWFELDGATNGIFQQDYTATDDGTPTALTGHRVEVRVQTQYIPTAATESTAPILPVVPAGQSTTHESEEDTMPQIEEARLRQLEEAAGRAPVLESERDAATKRAEEAETRALQAEAGTYARDFARNLVTKANSDLAEASVARIVRDALAKPLPLEESGRLDTAAFTPTVEEARTAEETYLAQVAEASGIGSVRGVGSTSAATVSEADVDQSIGGLFRRDVKGA